MPSVSRYRTWLAVPADEIEDLKKAHPPMNGHTPVLWDKEHKLWFARPGADLSMLDRWLPRPQEVSMNGSDPVTSVVPRISSLTVNLSPGASLPLVRTAMNNLSVVTFTDINGSPWPQSDPPYNAAPKLFDVQYNENMVTITPLRPWASGNISVYLKGLSVPVILNVTSGETDTPSSSQEMDSRLDLRIPRQGPTSPVVSIPTDKIALHDATLQAFLDGIPPRDPSVKRLKFTGNVPDTTIWQHGDDLLVRSRAMLRDEFEQTLSSADGTHLWKLPVTPLLTFSVNGQSVHVTPELE